MRVNMQKIYVHIICQHGRIDSQLILTLAKGGSCFCKDRRCRCCCWPVATAAMEARIVAMLQKCIECTIFVRQTKMLRESRMKRYGVGNNTRSLSSHNLSMSDTVSTSSDVDSDSPCGGLISLRRAASDFAPSYYP